MDLSELQWFQARVADALARTDDLAQRTHDSQPLDGATLLPLLDELRTAMEELQVANEELRARSDELRSARGIIELDRLRYRDLFMAAPDAYLVTDGLGVIQDANPGAASLLHMPASALRGRPLALHVPVPARQAFRRELNTLKGAVGVQRLTIALRTPDAQGGEATREVCASVRTLTPRSGSVELCWTLRDVEKPRQEAARWRELEASLTGGKHSDRLGDATTLAATIAQWWREATRGIVMVPDALGHLRAIAPSETPILVFERLQRRLGDGPALDAYRDGRAVEIPDLASDQRYPRFGPPAVMAGITAVRAYPLFGDVGEHPIGVLVLTDKQAGEVPEQLLRGAGLIAEVALTLTKQARDATEATELAAQLQQALDSRVKIEQAKGKLAERLRCKPDQAFQLMRRYARSHNLRLHDFAAQFVDNEITLDAPDSRTFPSS
ncbi:MAG: ANTAR domain-containing protein [Egibacteraceae bacterium]